MQENDKLSPLLQQFKSNSDENSISTYSFTPILQQLLLNAERNTGKLPTGRRHPEILKKFSTALFIFCGPLAYEFIQHNMPEALPSLRTVQNVIHKEYQTIDEGCFRYDGLSQHIKQYKAPNVVSIGEDATRVIARVDYDCERHIPGEMRKGGGTVNHHWLSVSHTHACTHAHMRTHTYT